VSKELFARKRKLILALAVIGAFAAVGLALLGGRLHRAEQLAKLENQMRLAEEDRSRLAVKELARRMVQIDSSAEQKLKVARVFLSVRAMDEFWATLKQVETEAPQCRATVEHLRADAFVAVEDWPAGVTALKRYLGMAGPTLDEKLAAWAELCAVQGKLELWEDALIAANIRIRLRDSWEARLVRAKALVRLRRWREAGEDFAWLKQNAPSVTEVKTILPCWERVEREMDALNKYDELIRAELLSAKPRLQRMNVEARLGLWQNAIEDGALALEQNQAVRLPLLLGSRLASGGTEGSYSRQLISKKEWSSVSWLASSHEVELLNETLEGKAELWRELLAADLSVLSRPSGWLAPSEYAVDRIWQARTEFSLGFREQAKADVSEVFQYVPNFLPAELIDLEIMLADGNLAEAGKALEKVIREYADLDGRVPGLSDELAGRIYQARGQHQAAVEAFSRSITDGRSAESLRARAKSLRLLQRFTEADRDLAEANKLSESTQQEGHP
jgi:hypothetical protein